MKWRTQKQNSGDGSLNVLAGRDVDVRVGLGYRDVQEVAKDVAMEVFKDNFIKLSQEAYATAMSRADEFIDNLLEELVKRDSVILKNLEDPGVQAAVLDAQSGYAKTGDPELGELLVGLLADRIRQDARDVSQLSLNAALEISQNLCTRHFSILSCNFFLKYVAFSSVRTERDIADQLVGALEPFEEDFFSAKQSDLNYLCGAGCLIMGAGTMAPGRYMGMNYPGLFSEGFTLEDFPPGRILLGTPLVVSHPEVDGRYKVAAITTAELESLIVVHQLQEVGDTARTALTLRLPSEERILEKVVSCRPEMRPFFSKWQDLALSSYLNTAAGIAIGHANVRRVTGGEFNTPIDNWMT
ncbi:LPO_1073/Vpar_1526 family protein [Streptomyces sp. NPDC093676]|uniref:LPO_1073/Vpar_1526 family protein n=1 Tax=Streptomyces sp. NPDC093676 TaxID=3366050 RepID=UPI0037F1F446